ncbi:MAG: HlyC/CorC family transporter [Deltaproteobacteria bacterium]|nr:HlyC/CorC family transporter [Deltaproteobacteria bacterium]
MRMKTFVRRLFGLHVTEEEIQSLIEEGEQEGVINRDEHAMIDAVLDLDETRVREVLVPRTDIVAIEKDMPLEQVLETIIAAGHSRIPVYDGDIDHILGILYAKDLLKYWGKTPDEINLGSLFHKAYFIPEGKTIGDLLKEFKARRVHMAVAVDEYGGTAGLITIEDILEEIVGDIQDEYDAEEQIPFTKLDDGKYIFDARFHIEDFEDKLGVSLARGDYDTLGGFISHTLGHVPARGEQCEVGSLHFTIEEADARKVTRILVTKSENGDFKT